MNKQDVSVSIGWLCYAIYCDCEFLICYTAYPPFSLQKCNPQCIEWQLTAWREVNTPVHTSVGSGKKEKKIVRMAYLQKTKAAINALYCALMHIVCIFSFVWKLSWVAVQSLDYILSNTNSNLLAE